MQQMTFPRYADDAVRLLIWTPDQVGPMAVMFIVGMLTNSLFTCAVIGLGASWMYTKYSAGKPTMYVLHLLYWHGVMPIKARCAINPFLRRILPL